MRSKLTTKIAQEYFRIHQLTTVRFRNGLEEFCLLLGRELHLLEVLGRNHRNSGSVFKRFTLDYHFASDNSSSRFAHN